MDYLDRVPDYTEEEFYAAVFPPDWALVLVPFSNTPEEIEDEYAISESN